MLINKDLKQIIIITLVSKHYTGQVKARPRFEWDHVLRISCEMQADGNWQFCGLPYVWIMFEWIKQNKQHLQNICKTTQGTGSWVPLFLHIALIHHCTIIFWVHPPRNCSSLKNHFSAPNHRTDMTFLCMTRTLVRIIGNFFKFFSFLKIGRKSI